MDRRAGGEPHATERPDHERDTTEMLGHEWSPLSDLCPYRALTRAGDTSGVTFSLVTDLDLRGAVEAAASGDAGAWNDLVDRYGSLVWAVARGEGLSPVDAADVCQTTWLRLAEHVGRIRSPEGVGTWLARTARHECWRVLRSGQRVDCIELDDLTSGEAPAADASVLEEEELRRLADGLALLSPPCRTLLRMLVADPPPSYAEVSEILDMPIGSIGPRRARCLDRLRRLVDTVAGGEEEPSSTGSRR